MYPLIKKGIKAIAYSNYHICALTGFLWKNERRALIPYAKKVSTITGESTGRTVIKMCWTSIATGCNFEEYYSLKFFYRSPENQNTMLTRYINHVVVYRFNNYDSNIILNNKSIFNNRFASYRNIKWIDLEENEEQIRSFFEDIKTNDVILKPKSGHSGFGVTIDNAWRILSEENLSEWKMKYEGFICEERLHNCKEIDELNSSSLNTIRAITFSGNIVWAGIRVGRPGEIVDNISQGGSICSIDVDSGKINSEAHDKSGKEIQILKDRPIIGFQIPNWDALRSMICQVSDSFPEMKFVAWDFALTDKGPVLIEGNNGVDNRISQVHVKPNETGLRPRLFEMIVNSV